MGMHSTGTLLALAIAAVLPFVSPGGTNDVDRTDPNFVTASLLVFGPGEELFSCAGHACIRLECPTYRLDYCFSYESEPISAKVLTFFAGRLKMGMFAIPTQEFLKQYDVKRNDTYASVPEALSKGKNYFKILVKTGTQVKTWYYNVDITAECGSPMVVVYSSAIGLYPRAAEGITSIAYAKINNDEAFDSVDAMKAAEKDVHYAPVVASGVTLDKSNFNEGWYQFIFDGAFTQTIKLYIK